MLWFQLPGALTTEEMNLMSKNKIFRNERLTYRLNMLASKAIAENDEIFLRETGLAIRELRVLRLIEDNPGMTFVDIAGWTGLERSLTSRIIQRLLREELIVRINSRQDARRFDLHITESGRAVCRIGEEVSDRLEEVLMEPLTEEERQVLDGLLEKLGGWVVSEGYRNRLSEQ
jgi:DNA-binding MarR family transcriptional regulator